MSRFEHYALRANQNDFTPAFGWFVTRVFLDRKFYYTTMREDWPTLMGGLEKRCQFCHLLVLSTRPTCFNCREILVKRLFDVYSRALCDFRLPRDFGLESVASYPSALGLMVKYIRSGRLAKASRLSRILQDVCQVQPDTAAVDYVVGTISPMTFGEPAYSDVPLSEEPTSLLTEMPEPTCNICRLAIDRPEAKVERPVIGRSRVKTNYMPKKTHQWAPVPANSPEPTSVR